VIDFSSTVVRRPRQFQAVIEACIQGSDLVAAVSPTFPGIPLRSATYTQEVEGALLGDAAAVLERAVFAHHAPRSALSRAINPIHE
jgi:hypothetical protein